MVFQNIAFWSVFSILTVLGLTMKTNSIAIAEPMEVSSSGFEHIAPVLYENGYRLRGVQTPTTDKNFVVNIYERLGCRGALILLPLIRNSEAAQLLKTRYLSEKGSAFFVLNGARYETFPDAQFWWNGFTSFVMSFGQTKSKSFVWSVVETRPCVDTTPLHKYF